MADDICEKLKINYAEVRTTSDEVIQHRGPFDLEVHKGVDGRYYIVGLGRLLPREGPIEDIIQHLIQTPVVTRQGERFETLRTSLLRRSDYLLRSDTFGRNAAHFLGVDRDTVERIHEAFLYSHLNVTDVKIFSDIFIVPHELSVISFQELRDIVSGLGKLRLLSSGRLLYLKGLHKLGYNYRHMGIIARVIAKALDTDQGELDESLKSNLTTLHDALVVEGCARTLKNLVWRALRSGSVQERREPLRIIHRYLLPYFGSTRERIATFWAKLHDAIHNAFPGLLHEILPNELAARIEGQYWKSFMATFSEVSGIELSTNVLNARSRLGRPLIEADVLSIGSRMVNSTTLNLYRCLGTENALRSKLEVPDTLRLEPLEHFRLAFSLLFQVRDTMGLQSLAVDEQFHNLQSSVTSALLWIGATLYNNGYGVLLDLEEGARWLKVGAETGLPILTFLYGLALMNGRGAQRDPIKAVTLISQAAQMGVTPALASLAACYRNGTGVSQDDSKAMKWYLRAANPAMCIQW